MMPQVLARQEGACDDFDRDPWWLPQQRSSSLRIFCLDAALAMGITDFQL